MEQRKLIATVSEALKVLQSRAGTNDGVMESGAKPTFIINVW